MFRRGQSTGSRPCWKLDSYIVFTVTSYYDYLHKGEMEEEGFPNRLIWNVKATSRIAFFTWEAVRGCILILNNLVKRGTILMNGCFLCRREVESSNHFLLWCPYAQRLWRLAYGLLGLDWVVAGLVKEFCA